MFPCTIHAQSAVDRSLIKIVLFQVEIAQHIKIQMADLSSMPIKFWNNVPTPPAHVHHVEAHSLAPPHFSSRQKVLRKMAGPRVSLLLFLVHLSKLEQHCVPSCSYTRTWPTPSAPMQTLLCPSVLPRWTRTNFLCQIGEKVECSWSKFIQI